jgi:hypothetical protein
MRKRWLVLGLGGAAVGVVLAWAWRDGGEEPLREIAAPVQLPGAAR